MMPGMNPRQMQAMMKQMGMQQTDIAAEQVIIRTADKDIVIDNTEIAMPHPAAINPIAKFTLDPSTCLLI